ncbi:MAG: hypothetical protein QOJ86_3096 [Bradyrhizobium sp.]|nr:hypothetical protein [Bradyrhizobium sp.]
MSTIEKLTPQMKAYSSHFADSGIINWLPYTMYFHPFSYTSPTVNTDSMGFRYSDARGCRYSFANLEGISGVRLLAGSSTVFGIGASADRHTLASRLTENDTRPEFWINFGGRSFNSTQELILYVLHRQMLPRVAEIVLFSGFNDLGLAHLPARYRRAHGAFFNCGDFYDALTKPRSTGLGSWFGRTPEEDTEDDVPGIDQQIGYAVDQTLRHLDTWRIMARETGARLTFVLQPLANWVRQKGCAEEEELFAELEQRGGFTATYGAILQPENFLAYAEQLKAGVLAMGLGFVNMAPLMASAIQDDQWVFVDRIHFTDAGHDFVAKLLLGGIDAGGTP